MGWYRVLHELASWMRVLQARCSLPLDAGPVFYIVTGEPFKQSAELTGEPIKMKA